MNDSVYKTLFNLKLLCNALTLYLCHRLQKSFKDIKDIKTLNFAGGWDKLQKHFVTPTIVNKIYGEMSKEIIISLLM